MPFPPTHPSLAAALGERGYAEPTPVQAAVLDPRAAAADLLVSAQTGSGKTVAYGLALAAALLEDEAALASSRAPLALIVAPTRELALQVGKELGWLYARTPARVASCVGGMDVRNEARALARGAQVVVGTPGRLCDHLERGRLDVSRLRAVVLDEADEMLDLGFREELERILDATPKNRRTLMFSATIPKGIAALAKSYQKDALRIATSAEDAPHGDIEYRAMPILARERDRAVVNVLRHVDARGALVFCSTRESVKHLHANLLERGFSVVALSGELTQPERTRALQALRDGRAHVCVATDVAARGLDLPDLGLVIHADPPHDRLALLHRSGRTGRAGRKGVCVVLVPERAGPPSRRPGGGGDARRRAERLFREASIDATWSPPPSAEDIRARDQVRIVREVALLAEDPTDEDLAAARALLAALGPEPLVAALVRQQRATLPAPEELTAVRPPSAPSTPDTPGRARGAIGDAVWFTVNVGRSGKADPRWLIPILCRRGQVTKADIGQIHILARETHVEIAASVATRFATAVRRPDPKDRHLRVAPLVHPRDDGGRRPPARKPSR